MASKRTAKPETYVKTAMRLLRHAPRGEVSAGQVAWHAHRRTARACEHDFAADRALSDSGLFERANFINSNTMGITLWRARQAAR
jgi:hypothetical protein